MSSPSNIPESRPSATARSRAPRASSPHRRDLLILLTLLLVPRLCFIAATPAQLGSVDLRSWEYVTDYLLKGGNPYAASRDNREDRRAGVAGKLNWPPFWLQILFGLGTLAALTSTALAMWIKLFLVTVEAVMVCLLYLYMRRCLRVEAVVAILAVGICLNPAAIFQTVVHCNYDVLVSVWVLAFIYALSRFSETREESLWLLAALFLGIAIWAKTVPVALTPLMFFGWKGISRAGRGVGVFLLFGPAAVAVSVIYVLSPGPVGDYVLSYRSIGGHYGVSGLLGLSGLRALAGPVGVFLQGVIGLGLVAVGFFAARQSSLGKRDILVLAILILVAIPTFGPGYGPQYLYWYLPLLCAYFPVTGTRNRRLMLALMAVVVVTYTVEYTLLGSHGQVYRVFVQSAELRDLGERLGGPAQQTLLRLPLFLGSIALLTCMLSDLWQRREAAQGQS